MHARQAGLKVQSCEHVRFWRNKNIIWEIKYKIEFQNPFNIMFCSDTWLNLSPEDVNTSPTHFLVYGLMLRDTITKAYLHRHIFYIYLKAHLNRQKNSSRNNRFGVFVWSVCLVCLFGVLWDPMSIFEFCKTARVVCLSERPPNLPQNRLRPWNFFFPFLYLILFVWKICMNGGNLGTVTIHQYRDLKKSNTRTH